MINADETFHDPFSKEIENDAFNRTEQKRKTSETSTCVCIYTSDSIREYDRLRDVSRRISRQHDVKFVVKLMIIDEAQSQKTVFARVYTRDIKIRIFNIDSR